MRRQILPCLLALTAGAFAQDFALVNGFPIVYAGTAGGDDFGVDIKVDPSGNVYVCGSTQTAAQGANYWVAKYNNSGVNIWKKEVNSSGAANDIPIAMALDSAGAVYVTGSIMSGDTPIAFFTTKLDTNGVVKYATPYQRVPGTPALVDKANDIVADDAGNCYVVGECSGGANKDYVIQKYTGDTGAIAWTSTRNGPGNGHDMGRAIGYRNGSVYVTGELYMSATDTDMGTYRINASNGSGVWSHLFGAPYANDQATANDLAVGSTGKIVVVGSRKIPDTYANTSAAALWLTETGAVISPKPGEENHSQVFSNNAVTHERQNAAMRVAIGQMPGLNFTSGNESAYFTYNGRWSDTIPNQTGVGTTIAHGVVLQAWNTYSADSLTGGLAVDPKGVGFSVSSVPTDSNTVDLMVMKYGYGKFFYNNGFTDRGNAIAVDNNENIWVVGSQGDTFNHFDIMLLKLIAKPVIYDDEYNTLRGQSLNVPAPGVLANDLSAYGATLVVDSGPSEGGTGSIATDGALSYTPIAGFSGTEKMKYHLAKSPFGNIYGMNELNVRVNVYPNITGLEIPETVVAGQDPLGIISFDGPEPFPFVSGLPQNATSNPPGLISFKSPPWAGNNPNTSQADLRFVPQGVTSDTPVTITVSRSGITASDSTVVKPGGLVGLTVTPTSVEGGETATGEVTIATPPSGANQTLYLSSNSSLIVLPPYVQVASGQTKASFTIQTKPTSSTVTRQITAFGYAYGFNRRTADITISQVLALKSVALNPTAVYGGQQTLITVTLNSKVTNPNGEIVNITDNSGSIETYGASVIGYNTSSNVFSANTSPVGSTATRQISVTFRNETKTVDLKVAAWPVLISLGISPNSVNSGNSATGTVTLNGPAGAGSVAVSLTDNTSAITTPSTVDVAGGSSAAGFAINTSPVGSTVTRSVSATFRGVTKTTNLTLYPPANLSSFIVTPSTVKGGSSTEGQIGLSAQIVGVGAVVNVTDNSSALTTPPSVTVNPGSSGAIFTINTSPVTATVTRTVTVSRNGVSKSQNVTLVP